MYGMFTNTRVHVRMYVCMYVCTIVMKISFERSRHSNKMFDVVKMNTHEAYLGAFDKPNVPNSSQIEQALDKSRIHNLTS